MKLSLHLLKGNRYIRYAIPEQVCVWNEFNFDSIDIDTTDSPYVCFTTDCGSCLVSIERHNQSGLSIYPNPAVDLLTIEVNEPGQHNIEKRIILHNGKIKGFS